MRILLGHLLGGAALLTLATGCSNDGRRPPVEPRGQDDAEEGEPPCPEGTRSADGECHPSQGEEGEGEGEEGEGEEGEGEEGEGEGGEGEEGEGEGEEGEGGEGEGEEGEGGEGEGEPPDPDPECDYELRLDPEVHLQFMAVFRVGGVEPTVRADNPGPGDGESVASAVFDEEVRIGELDGRGTWHFSAGERDGFVQVLAPPGPNPPVPGERLRVRFEYRSTVRIVCGFACLPQEFVSRQLVVTRADGSLLFATGHDAVPPLFEPAPIAVQRLRATGSEEIPCLTLHQHPVLVSAGEESVEIPYRSGSAAILGGQCLYIGNVYTETFTGPNQGCADFPAAPPRSNWVVWARSGRGQARPAEP